MTAMAGETGRRLQALDITRTAAILGMIAVHVGGLLIYVPTGAWRVFHLAAGYAAGTFAVAAGVSLSIMLPSPDAPSRGWRAMAPTVLRGVVLFGLGLAVRPIAGQVLVILCVYGALFVIAPVFGHVPARGLLALGAALALAWPVVSLAIRRRLTTPPPALELSWGALTDSDAARIVARVLLLDGAYPLPTWLALVLIAWGAHRTGLLAPSRWIELAAAGAALVGLGFGGSALVEAAWQPRAEAIGDLSAQGVPVWDAEVMVDHVYGVPSTLGWSGLLTAGHHSGTTFEVVQILAVATCTYVLAVGLAAARDPGPALARVLAWPGRIALTLYVGHLALLWAIPRVFADDAAPGSPPWLLTPRGTTIELAVFWLLAFAVGGLFRHRRGPLEAVLRRLTHPQNPLMLRR